MDGPYNSARYSVEANQKSQIILKSQYKSMYFIEPPAIALQEHQIREIKETTK